jgi:SAM-dependent methyltransferase
MSAQTPVYHNPEFDAYAEDYDAALAKGISVSGEDKEFFARGRIELLKQRLAARNFKPAAILDFGCGTGSSTPYLLGIPGAKLLTGTEVSAGSIKVAERLHGASNVSFKLIQDYAPKEEFHLAFCNGVFHHIPLAERAAAISYVFNSLRPNGLFALWENNPWNPGTRLVMSRIPFDKDAITLSCLETTRLLHSGGFEIVSRDFAFYFPRALAALRVVEPALMKLPFGAQYMVLARKPA